MQQNRGLPLRRQRQDPGRQQRETCMTSSGGNRGSPFAGGVVPPLPTSAPPLLSQIRPETGMAGGDLANLRCVSGFSDALDWRPTLFHEPVVAQRACALCGVVARKAVRLSCAHTMCTECQANCLQLGSRCPLDDESFCEEDLIRFEVSDGFLAKRKVACWNTLNGCDFVGTIDSLSDHFKECTFHVVSCPRCHRSVLRRNIVQHTKDRSCELTATKTAVQVTHGMDSVEIACSEVKEAVAKISEDLMSLQTSLNRCCEDVRAVDAKCERHLEVQAMSLAGQINELSALCTAGFAEDRRTLHEAMADCRDQLARQLSVQGDRAVEATNKLSQSFAGLCGPKTSHWYFAFWEDLKRRAIKKGYADAFGPVRDMFGYRVSLCADIGKEEDQLRFGCFLTVHGGQDDGELEWPFGKVYTVGVIHPEDKSNVISIKVDASKYSGLKNFEKPKGVRNLSFGDPYLSTPDKLESEGFVSNGELHLFMTIEP